MKGEKQQPYFSKGWKERRGQNSFLVALGSSEPAQGEDPENSRKRKRSTDTGSSHTLEQLLNDHLGESNSFETLSDGLDQPSSVLIQHFITEFAQEGNTPSGKLTQLKFERQHLRTVLCARAGESLLLYNAIIVLAAKHYGVINQMQSDHTTDSKIFVMTLLNEALADPNHERSHSDEVVASIAILAGLDFCYGDKEAFKFKISELDRIVTARGGIDKIDDYALLPLCAAAIDLARFASMELAFESKCKTSPPRIGGIPDNFTLPVGFRYLEDQCYLRSEIWEAVKPLAIMAIPSITASLEPLDTVEKWLLDPDCLPYICCFSPFQSHDDDVALSLAHDAVRLGCLAFLQILKPSAERAERNSPPIQSPIFESYSKKLAQNVCSDTLTKSIYAELTLWALCTFCTLQASKRTFRNYTRNKFVLSLVDELKIHKFEQLTGLMACFLYVPNLQNKTLRNLWDLLAEHRDAEVSTGSTDSLKGQMAPASRFDKRVLQKMDPSRPILSPLYL